MTDAQFVPTPSDWLLWVRSQMGISTTVLPDDSAALTYAWTVSIYLVNSSLAAVPGPMYQLAVYNLAGSNLINFAQDEPGQTYFRDLRERWNINSFVAGVINSSSDQGTSQSLTVLDMLQTLTLGDLQLLKDPWGRAYLAIAQNYGPTVWGVS